MRSPAPPSFPPLDTTLTSIPGLRAAGVCAGIKASGNPDLALLVAERPTTAHALFTQNHYAAAPVLLSKAHLAATGGRVRAVVVNSGNANACTGDQGERDALEMCLRVSAGLGCPLEEVLVCSTGVIGVKLPMDKVRAGIDAALQALQAGPQGGREFLKAIMTTDAFPKEACAHGPFGTVAGVCKGAGMIDPRMATMLAFVATDAPVTARGLQRLVPAVARTTFNAVHVDSHTSTNDTLLVLSTGGPSSSDDVDVTFADALASVCHRLSWLIARDGEGATKVTTITVRGAASDAAAEEVARAVAASALVRTALFGNDPNWGRFVSMVGNVAAVKKPRQVRCVLQGVEVFRGGEPTPFDRAQVRAAMDSEDVALDLHLEEGRGQARVLTSDLGYRYVEVNAEYTT